MYNILMLVKKCITCGKEFKTWKFDFDRRKNCSKDCYFESQKGKPARHIPEKTGEVRKCEWCSKEIYISKWRISVNKSGLFHCSDECRGLNMKGNKSPCYKDGSSIRGYYRDKIINKNHKVKYHRWVVEQYIGRELTKLEQVHHIDKNKTNNEPSNLYIFDSCAAHSRHHRYGNPLLKSNLNEYKT